MAKRKKINPRVLLVLCVLGVILVGAIVAFFIQRLPKDPTTDIQIAEEEVVKENPNWSKVFQHLAAARANSKDQQATNLLFREAELHFEMLRREPGLSRLQRDEQQQKGWRALQQVIRQDNRHIKARRMLSQFYGAIAQANPKSTKVWQDYIGELDGILSVDPRDAETYYHRARAYAQLAMTDPQHQQNAVEDFRKAVELDKTNAEYHDILGRYLVSIGRIPEAEQVFHEAIQTNPNKALLRVSFARLLRQQKRLEEAQKQIQEAIRCEPSSPLGYLNQASDLILQKRYEEAEEILKKAQNVAPTDLRVYAQYIILYRLKHDRRAADRVLREGLAALEKEDAEAKDDDKIGARRRGQIRATLNFMLADVLLDLYAMSKDEKEKEKLLSEARERSQILSTLSMSQMQKDQIAGRIAYYEKKWIKARKLLENVVDRDPTSRVAVMLLNVYRHLGIPGQSEKLAERVLKRRRLTPEGQLLFLLELAQLRISSGGYDEAQKLVRQAAKIKPNDENVKRLQEALDTYHGKKTTPGKQGRITRAMLFRRVQNLMLNDENDQAEAILEKMLQNNPSDVQVLSSLVSLLMQNQKLEKALEWVTKVQSNDPQNEKLKRLGALLKEPVSEKRYGIEMGFIDQSQTEDPLTKALQKWSIATRYGKTKDAQTYLEEAEKLDPNNNIVINIRFRNALLEKDWTAAAKWIDRLQEDETGILRDLQRARLAMAHGQALREEKKNKPSDAQFHQALSHLQEVLRVAPHLPVPRLLMAECYKQLGKVDEARKQYKDCYDNNPQNLQAIIGLAKLARQTGRTAEQIRWIKEAHQLPAGKGNSFVQEEYLQILESDPQNFPEAIQRRERILKHDPDNLSNAFRLAVLYEKTGQLNRAQEMIEYIYQRTPTKLTFAPMLANLYLRMNRPTKADEMFSDLLKSAKTNEEKVLTRIAYADFLAQSDEAAALRMYEMAIAEEGDKGKVALQALSNFHAAHAQRLASQGNTKESRDRWNTSIDLLRKIIERHPSDRTVQRLLLARYIDAGQYDKAVAGYQEMIRANPDDIEARLGLGLTYLQSDQLEPAEEQFNEVIKINPDISEAYRFRSRVYQSQMELSKAAADVNTSANLTGSIAQKLELARLYESMGDVQQAAQTYDAVLAENPDELPAYRGLLNLFHQQKRWSALDTLARKGMEIFPQRPDFALSLASAAQEQGNTNGQLHWLERAVEIAPNNGSIMRRYWTALLKNRDYVRLQRETQKYGNQPAHLFGVKAVLVAAQAKQNPGSTKPFQELLSLLHSASNSYDVYFVGRLLEEAYGSAKIVAKSSEICKARPEDKDVYIIVGDACLQEKQYPQAERNYIEAMELCKNTSGRIPLYLRLAQLYTHQGEYPRVAEQYRAILKDNPSNIIALNNLAYTCIDHLSNPQEGLKLIQRAMKITPGDPNLVDTYAWALARLGRVEESRDMLEKILEMGSATGSAERLYHMGYVLEKTGDPGEAGKYYRQALEVARAQKNSALETTIHTAMARVERDMNKE